MHEYDLHRHNTNRLYSIGKGVRTNEQKGIQNSSIEQLKKDHETETAFKADDPKQSSNRKQMK